MNASPDPYNPLPGTDRLVLRPQTPLVLFAGLPLGLMFVLCAAAGWLISPLASIGGLAIGAATLYAIFGGHLWADSERVGTAGPFQWRSCLRDEVDYLQIRWAPPYGRSRTRECQFVRKDGGVAFTAAAFVYGKAQLGALASNLRVPLYESG